MLNLLSGILLPDSDHIKVEDTVVKSLPEKERRNFRINSTLKIDNEAVNIARSPVLEFGEDFEENGGRELLNKSL